VTTQSVTGVSRAVQQRRGPLQAVPEANVYLASDAPLIAPGIYLAVGTGKDWQRYIFRTWKLAVQFKVLVNGPEQPEEQVTLERWYHVDVKQRRIAAGRHSDYRREWTLATARRPTRADRLAPRVFARVMFKVEVKTVVKNWNQYDLSEPNQYSIIGRILERVAGGSQP
jgi:hypothetical protein